MIEAIEIIHESLSLFLITGMGLYLFVYLLGYTVHDLPITKSRTRFTYHVVDILIPNEIDGFFGTNRCKRLTMTIKRKDGPSDDGAHHLPLFHKRFNNREDTKPWLKNNHLYLHFFCSHLSSY